MVKSTLTPRLLADFVAASPEGFFNRSELDRISTTPEANAEVLADALAQGIIGCEGDSVFDLARLAPEQVSERSALFSGTLPQLKKDGTPVMRPVTERLRARDERLQKVADYRRLSRLLKAFEGTAGYLSLGQLCTMPGDETGVGKLLDMSLLKASDDLIFDPLRITRTSLTEIRQKQVISPLREQIADVLNSLPGKTAPRSNLIEQFGSNALQMVIDSGGFAAFSVPIPMGESFWIRLKDSDPDAAYQVALEAVKPKDEDWAALLPQCGLEPAPGVPDGSTAREKALACTYTTSVAASHIGVRKDTLQSAIMERQVRAFADPEGVQRIPVSEVEAILAHPEWMEQIAGLEVISQRELAIVMKLPMRAVAQKLRKSNIGANRKVRWRQIAGMYDLPESLREFRALYATRKVDWIAAREEERAEERRQRDERRHAERTRRDEERRQREELRARLLAAFPAWQHAGRIDQQVILHVGPPNSGKTHNALDTLSIANNGWYLAPLRLLAFEIFDRLNQRGIRCNLLTGEEYIPVPGANVTAATIEMFDPTHSGNCVIIDEAQMLADPDRGWAWTRALMEAQAPDIHVIGPSNARNLIERLASAAAIPIQIIEHERLAP